MENLQGLGTLYRQLHLLFTTALGHGYLIFQMSCREISQLAQGHSAKRPTQDSNSDLSYANTSWG